MKLEKKFHPAALDRIIDQSRDSGPAPTLEDLGRMAVDTITMADELSPGPAQRDANVAEALQTIDELLRRRREGKG